MLETVDGRSGVGGHIVVEILVDDEVRVADDGVAEARLDLEAFVVGTSSLGDVVCKAKLVQIQGCRQRRMREDGIIFSIAVVLSSHRDTGKLPLPLDLESDAELNVLAVDEFIAALLKKSERNEQGKRDLRTINSLRRFLDGESFHQRLQAERVAVPTHRSNFPELIGTIDCETGFPGKPFSIFLVFLANSLFSLASISNLDFALDDFLSLRRSFGGLLNSGMLDFVLDQLLNIIVLHLFLNLACFHLCFDLCVVLVPSFVGTFLRSSRFSLQVEFVVGDRVG